MWLAHVRRNEGAITALCAASFAVACPGVASTKFRWFVARALKYPGCQNAIPKSATDILARLCQLDPLLLKMERDLAEATVG